MLDEKDLQAIAKMFEPINQRFDTIDKRFDTMDTRLNKIEHDTLSTKVTLENETNRNIKVIAEGHLDLSRKLDDALRVNNEKEMLLVRMNILENEVKQLKEKLA